MKLSEELQWRGFANQTTYKDISQIDSEPITFYFGVDPSASSMTIGNLAAVMMVRKFIKAGHQAVILIGGATGLIGDPDGKATERELKSVDEVQRYKEGIISQYESLFEGMDFEVVDNYEWFKNMGYLEFLRSVGKHVPMRQMLGRDFVQSRLGEDGAGISYAEFSYVLIQAYDFLYLNQNHGVSLQLCGSDQWGNSIAGVDLIRRITGHEAHVWSIPLVVNKTTGVKFGKSEEGAIWLDPNLTSPFKFYQFWLNVDDQGVEDYLKIYTELSKEKTDEVMSQFKVAPHERLAQKTLAREVTTLVHGAIVAEAVVRASEVLFGQESFLDISDVEKSILINELGEICASGDLLNDIVTSGLAASKSQARTFVQSGAISINGEKVTLESAIFRPGYNLMKRGKNNFAIFFCK